MFLCNVIWWYNHGRKGKKENLRRFEELGILLVYVKEAQIHIIKTNEQWKVAAWMEWMIHFSTCKGFWKVDHASFLFFSLSESFSLALSCLPFQIDWVAVNIWKEKKKKKKDPTYHIFDPLRPLCPLRVRGLDRAMFQFLLPCQVRMGFTVLKVSGLSLYPKHPSRVLREADKLCIAIYFKCLIKISWKQEVRGKE